MSFKSEENFVFSAMIVFIIVVFTGLFFLHKSHMGEYQKDVVIIQGIVDNKEVIERKCGKHDRYTCTDYLLTIDKKEFYTTLNRYSSASIGSYYILYKTVEETPWYAKIFIIALLPCFILGPILVGVGLAQNTIRNDKEKY